MCGRFTLANPAAAFNAMPWLRDVPPISPRYNIAPGQRTLIICDQSGPEVRLAAWGLRKTWDTTKRDLLINARSEKVLETPSFSESFRHRRCVIPADGFYEWRKSSTSAEPHFFRLTGAAPFCFAGLYEGDGDSLKFVVLTTAANSLVKRVHLRMPVMLAPADAMAYMSTPPDAPEMRQFFQPVPACRMESYRVNPLVNRIENDFPACMELYKPVSEGQGDLFSHGPE